jgi:hypothetical protein
MSLIKREPSPAQAAASRGNSLLSTGPRTARGKAIAGLNGLATRRLSPVEALNIMALNEEPGDFETLHQDLSAAMRPRDDWESAWVQDIATLRWRLWRLQRAEGGILAVRKQKVEIERQRLALSDQMEAPENPFALQAYGCCRLPDSLEKFENILTMLGQVREGLGEPEPDPNLPAYLDYLYGQTPGPLHSRLKSRFEGMVKSHAEGDHGLVELDREALLAAVDKEISKFKQLLELYRAEHLEENARRQDAELLLPTGEMNKVIRYETHLEDQIERKLRQFYARRRESNLPEAEALPATTVQTEGGEPACPAAAA